MSSRVPWKGLGCRWRDSRCVCVVMLWLLGLNPGPIRVVCVLLCCGCRVRTQAHPDLEYTFLV